MQGGKYSEEHEYKYRIKFHVIGILILQPDRRWVKGKYGVREELTKDENIEYRSKLNATPVQFRLVERMGEREIN